MLNSIGMVCLILVVGVVMFLRFVGLVFCGLGIIV